MIYVTGDTHGMAARLSIDTMPFTADWTKSDYLIVCGDFGYVYSGSSKEELFLRELSFRPYNVLFVDGNRDNFTLLRNYPAVPWHGGLVRKIRRNVIQLLRGQVYEIDGRSVFTMGGGYSIDRSRRDRGSSWWPEEMPSAEEYETARKNLLAAGMRVDTVITHAAPTSAMESITGDNENERPLNDFLEWVRTSVTYRNWYFGHLHIDAMMENNLYATFLSVREMDTGMQVW